MIMCSQCESLIPEYYKNCPVCGTELKIENRIRFKRPVYESSEIEHNPKDIYVVSDNEIDLNS